MKIKLFLAPSLIVIIITLIIWTVYPAYTNGVDGVKEKYQKLGDRKRLMASLDERAGNVEKLVADLNSNASDNTVVFDYISQKKEDEKIIDNLDLLARDSSVSVVNISVSEIKRELISNAEISEASTPVLGTDSTVPVQSAIATKAEPDKLKVDFSVFGNYENIKILAEKVQKLKRFSKISGLEIKTQLKEDQGISESLLASMTLEFNYLKEPSMLTDGDIDNSIFSSGVFDKSIIEKIKNSRNISVNNVSPGQKGKTNPFLP
ncbi:MAG TPA: hypothetical protein DCS28_02720 [Candidatus Moranbacteria bacterium]|nr:hypothetical protein [Candidatus Moranbacteria bacterium]HAT74929.1 hypothetical protein [Candidatus Moranbacteria bacterium]